MPNLRCQKLELGQYIMTREKAKDLIVTIQPKLATVIYTYELNFNGASQLVEKYKDYVQVDLLLCINEDDKGGYLERGTKDSFVLY